ncbi:hypothetical protein GLOTRDRAFT_94304 [Gloeophyllum trabeum ATCC 11539]|uniref:Uncharacterized protein n=1 Tax=Gloeophyllum trabeum (strain ATCC 11539 / FP-39264 / Madison 617) TaxID=670483 RepID=S7Q623_GLOTA|nr:uncharacterized protein GLOTRDRAFT_94304 [Gloeophyllum trabeum ATCC 11539]EPQ54932.1 hypothetical protein GLOTRDRAFT_94304 [Gloeophyllum trabeum ATCC 11539]
MERLSVIRVSKEDSLLSMVTPKKGNDGIRRVVFIQIPDPQLPSSPTRLDATWCLYTIKDTSLAHWIMSACPNLIKRNKQKKKKKNNNNEYLVYEFTNDFNIWFKAALKAIMAGPSSKLFRMLCTADIVLGATNFANDASNRLVRYLNGMRALTAQAFVYPDPFQVLHCCDKLQLADMFCTIVPEAPNGVNPPACMVFDTFEQLVSLISDFKIDLTGCMIKRTYSGFSQHVLKMDPDETLNEFLVRIRDTMEESDDSWARMRTYSGFSQHVLKMDPDETLNEFLVRIRDTMEESDDSWARMYYDIFDVTVLMEEAEEGMNELKDFAGAVLKKLIKWEEDHEEDIVPGSRTRASQLRIFARLDICLIRQDGEFRFWVNEVEAWSGASMFANFSQDAYLRLVNSANDLSRLQNNLSTYRDYRMTYRDYKMTYRDYKMTYRDYKATYCDYKMTYRGDLSTYRGDLSGVTLNMLNKSTVSNPALRFHLGCTYQVYGWIEPAFCELMSTPVHAITRPMAHLIGPNAFYAIANTHAQIAEHRLVLAFYPSPYIEDVSCFTSEQCRQAWTTQWWQGLAKHLLHPDAGRNGRQILDMLETVRIPGMCQGCQDLNVSWVKQREALTRDEEMFEETIADIVGQYVVKKKAADIQLVEDGGQENVA